MSKKVDKLVEEICDDMDEMASLDNMTVEEALDFYEQVREHTRAAASGLRG